MRSLTREARFRFIKIMDMGYMVILYFMFGVLLSMITDFIFGGYTEEEINEGILSYKEISLYCKHYGVDKSRFKLRKEGFDYDKEIEFIYRCIKSTKLIDVEYLQEKIKVIQNV
jgi:hypothetical protein